VVQNNNDLTLIYIKMNFRVKNLLKVKINAYFVFVALAFTVSAYFLLLDNVGSYVARGSVLLNAKDETAAVSLDKIRENIIVLAEKNNILSSDEISVSLEKETSLIDFETRSGIQVKAENELDEAMRNFIDNAGKYYDIKDEIGLEIVFRRTVKENLNSWVILVLSLVIGVAGSIVVQIILDGAEKLLVISLESKSRKSRQDLDNMRELERVLNLNREKIQNLTFPKLEKIKEQKESDIILKNEIAPNKPNFKFGNEEVKTEKEEFVRFKKAASPANLPIAVEDIAEEKNNEAQDFSGEIFVDENYAKDLENRILGNISHIDKEESANSKIKEDVIYTSEKAEEKPVQTEEKEEKVFTEPTEEEFKKRLNQLLGN